MDNSSQQFCDAFIQEVKRRLFKESVFRIKKCLSQLEESEIWYRPNENSNSVGNLILHLCGNVRQWILSGLAKNLDTRQRQTEFDEKGPIPAQQLLQDLDQLMAEVDQALDLIKPEHLLEMYAVQGFQESGISILTHVVEHFSYHVGQITYITKALKDKDLGYYSGLNLEKKN